MPTQGQTLDRQAKREKQGEKSERGYKRLYTAEKIAFVELVQAS